MQLRYAKEYVNALGSKVLLCIGALADPYFLGVSHEAACRRRSVAESAVNTW